MAAGMALQINRYRQSRYVTREVFDMHIEGGDSSAHAEGADSESVNFIKQLCFHYGVEGIRVSVTNRPEQGLLRYPDAFVHCAAYAHADNHGRAGLAPGVL